VEEDMVTGADGETDDVGVEDAVFEAHIQLENETDKRADVHPDPQLIGSLVPEGQ